MLHADRFRTLGLSGLAAVVTMLIVAAIGAASASATLPEFSKYGVCTQAGAITGWPTWTKGSIWYWSNSTCSSHSAPTVAFALGAGEYGQSPFYSTSGKGKLVTVKGNVVECSGDENIGELTGSQTDRVVVKFTGCHATLFGIPLASCTSSGQSSGTIITVTVISQLGYINKTTKLVGDLLTPTGGEASEFTKFECGTEKVAVTGSVIGVVPENNAKGEKQYNTSRTTYELVFKQTGGKQEVSKFEGEGTTHRLLTSINGGTSEESAEETTDNLTTSEAGELKA